jgi:spore maturation protein SpmA
VSYGYQRNLCIHKANFVIEGSSFNGTKHSFELMVSVETTKVLWLGVKCQLYSNLVGSPRSSVKAQ